MVWRWFVSKSLCVGSLVLSVAVLGVGIENLSEGWVSGEEIRSLGVVTTPQSRECCGSSSPVVTVSQRTNLTSASLLGFLSLRSFAMMTSAMM